MGSFFLRTLLGAEVVVLTSLLFLARVWPVVVVLVVAEATFSTPPPIFTCMVESPECGFAAADGDSGGEESSGEEL